MSMDIAFFYRKANIRHMWSNILRKFYGDKGPCHGCRSQWFRWKLALFTRPLSSCDIKISVVAQCRILVAVQYMNTRLFGFFYPLTTCTCWTAQWLGQWSLLTRTDADRELADWQPTHESGNTNTDLNMTQTAATQYTRSTLPTNSTQRSRLLCVPISDQAPPQPPADAGQKHTFSEIFTKPPDGNMANIAKMPSRPLFSQRTENCQWSCRSFGHARSAQGTRR